MTQDVFVTGGSGFVGAHLLCALLEKGHTITAVKRRETSLKEFTFIAGLYFGHGLSLVIKNLTWIEADLLSPDSYEEFISEGQMVYHCAGMVSFEKRDKHNLMRNNTEVTKNLVDVCLYKKIKKLIYVSSTAAVGAAPENELTDESDLWDEKSSPSNYSVSKYYAEIEVWRGVEEGLSAVIVNPPLIIGAGNWQKNTGRFFLNAYHSFPFYTPGANAFVYVNDVAEIMIKLANSGIENERFLLPSENMELKDFFDNVAQGFGKKKPSIKVNKAMAEIAWRLSLLWNLISGTRGLITKETAMSGFKRVRYSNEKIKKALNYQFTPIDKAIELTIQAFLKNKGE